MALKAFRRTLAGELPKWEQEGIVSPVQADQLKQKYQLDNLQQESQSILINTIFIFGAVVIACGIITFVAAHWETIPKYLKLCLLIGVMVAVDCGGFYLWKVKENSPRLGHALIILGSLIFAANIGLIAQIFHLQTDFYNGFLVWAMGTMVIGYTVGSIPLVALACITSFVWFCGEQSQQLPGMYSYFGLILLAFLPFAYWVKSRSVHFLTVLGCGAAIIFYLFTKNYLDALKWVIIGITSLGTILITYEDWPFIRKWQDFGSDCKILGFLGLAASSYILSFHEINYHLTPNWDLTTDSLIIISSLLLLTLITFVYGYVNMNKTKAQLSKYEVTIAILIMLLVSINLTSNLAMWLGTILANLAVVTLGGLLFWLGVSKLDRRYFWLGLLLLVLELASRFFEYETGLLWKSLAFVVIGLAVIYGGIWFEKKYHRQEVVNAN